MKKLMHGNDVIAVAEDFVWVAEQHGWSNEKTIYSDTEMAFTVVADAKVSPVEFKLLFTAEERVAIKAARINDPVVDDFFSIVDDPRLTHVNLGLQSTQDALAYLETKGLIIAARRAQILAGQVQ